MSTDLLRCVTLEEAAERLGVGPTTVYEMRRSGRLRCVKLGRAVRVPMSEIARLLEPEDVQSGPAKKLELFPRMG